MAKQQTKEDISDKNFAMPRQNYKYIAIGCAIIVVGFLLMLGGGGSTATTFDESMYSFRRITLAPIVVIAGFVFVGYAIMRKPKNTEKINKNN